MTVRPPSFLVLFFFFFFFPDSFLLSSFSDDFRLFVGDLGNEVTDETLRNVFNKYPSFLKCKVVRDRRTGKSRGYGFISFKDPADFARVMKEMNGDIHLLPPFSPPIH